MSPLCCPLQILYSQQSVEVPAHLHSHLIRGLQPETEYSFVLMSRGSVAGGLQQQVSVRTAPDLLHAKPAHLQQNPEEGGRLTFSLPRVPAEVSVRSVLGRLGAAVAQVVDLLKGPRPIYLIVKDASTTCSFSEPGQR